MDTYFAVLQTPDESLVGPLFLIFCPHSLTNFQKYYLYLVVFVYSRFQTFTLFFRQQSVRGRQTLPISLGHILYTVNKRKWIQPY